MGKRPTIESITRELAGDTHYTGLVERLRIALLDAGLDPTHPEGQKIIREIIELEKLEKEKNNQLEIAYKLTIQVEEKKHEARQKAGKKRGSLLRDAWIENLARDHRKLKPDDNVGEGIYYVRIGLEAEDISPLTDSAIRKKITDLYPKDKRKPGRPRNK